MSNLSIYQPQGKAGEYASWACNLYTGCSNSCSYCYCRAGHLGKLWTPYPQLKKSFKNEEHAYTVFLRELKQNKDALRRDGLFFSFTTDPMLPQTRKLTWNCILTAINNVIPVSVLTKRADFFEDIHIDKWIRHDNLAWGFTLTGMDHEEPMASTNAERIDAMRQLHMMGFKTFASLEPVIDPSRTIRIYTLLQEYGCCDLVKVGLQSGRKDTYPDGSIGELYQTIKDGPIPSYVKHSVTDYLGLPQETPKNVFAL